MSDQVEPRPGAGDQWWELGGVMRALRRLNGTGEFAPTPDRSTKETP